MDGWGYDQGGNSLVCLLLSLSVVFFASIAQFSILQAIRFDGIKIRKKNSLEKILTDTHALSGV